MPDVQSDIWPRSEWCPANAKARRLVDSIRAELANVAPSVPRAEECFALLVARANRGLLCLPCRPGRIGTLAADLLPPRPCRRCGRRFCCAYLSIDSVCFDCASDTLAERPAILPPRHSLASRWGSTIVTRREI